MNDSEPLVSILMPTLNAARYVEDSLASIASQRIERLEVVISDGGSSDDTLQRARDFAVASGLDVTILLGSDSGQSNGLNRALQASRGEILGWMNASDEYCEGSLRALVDVLVKSQRVLLAFGHYETIDESCRRISWTPALPPWAWVHRHESFVTNAQSMLWRRELQERIGDFDESLHRTMDYDLIQRFLDAARRGEAKRIDVTVGRFRRHEGQKTTPGQGDVVHEEHAAIQVKLGRRSARDARWLMHFWFSGRLVRLWAVIRFDGFAGARRSLLRGPRVVPIRAKRRQSSLRSDRWSLSRSTRSTPATGPAEVRARTEGF